MRATNGALHTATSQSHPATKPFETSAAGVFGRRPLLFKGRHISDSLVFAERIDAKPFCFWQITKINILLARIKHLCSKFQWVNLINSPLRSSTRRPNKWRTEPLTFAIRFPQKNSASARLYFRCSSSRGLMFHHRKLPSSKHSLERLPALYDSMLAKKWILIALHGIFGSFFAHQTKQKTPNAWMVFQSFFGGKKFANEKQKEQFRRADNSIILFSLDIHKRDCNPTPLTLYFHRQIVTFDVCRLIHSHHLQHEHSVVSSFVIPCKIIVTCAPRPARNLQKNAEQWQIACLCRFLVASSPNYYGGKISNCCNNCVFV